MIQLNLKQEVKIHQQFKTHKKGKLSTLTVYTLMNNNSCKLGYHTTELSDDLHVSIDLIT